MGSFSFGGPQIGFVLGSFWVRFPVEARRNVPPFAPKARPNPFSAKPLREDRSCGPGGGIGFVMQIHVFARGGFPGRGAVPVLMLPIVNEPGVVFRASTPPDTIVESPVSDRQGEATPPGIDPRGLVQGPGGWPGHGHSLRNETGQAGPIAGGGAGGNSRGAPGDPRRPPGGEPLGNSSPGSAHGCDGGAVALRGEGAAGRGDPLPARPDRGFRLMPRWPRR